MAEIKQSTTRNRMFFMVSSSDHISAKTGAAPVVNLSKNAGAFAGAGGTVSEISNGWYNIALNTTDTNTLGDLAYHITGTGADDTDFCDQVVANLLGDIFSVNVTQVDGASLTAHAAGKLPADVLTWLGTAVTAATAGIPDINVKNMNNVSAAAITTINANQGTTQPINFTGTGASALIKSDVIDIVSVAAAIDANNLLKVDVEDWKAGVVPAVNVTGVPKVDLVDWLGSAPNALSQGKVDAINSLRTNTAQANAGDVTSIKLDAGASAVDGFYVDTYVMITGGTGAGQIPRLIYGYAGATKIASIVPNWTTAPDATSVFIVFGEAQADTRLWRGIVAAANSGNLGMPGVSVQYWNDFVIPTPNVNGVPVVDVIDWRGSTPNILIAGRIDSNMQAVLDGVLTAAKFAAGAFDAVWTVATRTLTGFSTALALSVWDVLESAIATASSIGLKLKTNLDVVLSTGIQNRLPASLSGAGNMKSDILEINDNATDANRLKSLMDGTVVAQVNGVASTTSIPADGFVETTNDHFKGRLITFTSGALIGQQTDITAYNGGSQTFTVTALTEAPADNDFFVIS